MDDPSQPGDPDEPGNSPIPGLPGFLFGASGNPPFDPATFDLSQIDLGQVMRMLQSDGPVNWEVARQTAQWVALEGKPEPAVAPADRAQFEELAHAAQTLVVGETGLAATFATTLATVGPMGWVELHLLALRPVLEALATTLGDAMQDGDDDDAPVDLPDLAGTPFAGMAGIAGMGDMLGLLAPALLGVQAGSMIGYLAQHALGRYDLPLPTSDAPSLCFVVTNIDTFESEWSLPRDDLRFYVALHEAVHAAARSVAWLRERFVALSTAVRVELRDRPVGVRGRIRDDRSAGPRGDAADEREPRTGARRDAVAPSERTPRGAATAHRGRRRVRRPRARHASGSA